MEKTLLYRTDVLAALHQITLDVVNRHDIHDTLQALLVRTNALLDVSDSSFDLLASDDLLVTYAVTPNQPLQTGDQMRRGEGGWLSWQAIRTGEPAVLEDYSLWECRRDLYEEFPIHAIAIIPVFQHERVVGTINISRREKNRPFNTTDLEIAKQLSEMVALVLENAQLHTQLQNELRDRKRIEATLRENQETFQRYFNMGTVGMGVIAPNMKWLETNDRLRQMLGYTDEELKQLTWTEMTHADDLDTNLLLFNQILDNQRDSYELDKRYLRKDGTVVFTTAYVSCYRNQNGTVRYCLASLVDISGRKQAESTLRKLTAIEERQRLARDLHDSVNQSIHGLMLFCETLDSTLERNQVDRARQIARRLHESARQALKETRLMLYEMQDIGSGRNVNLIHDLETRLATVEHRAGVRAEVIQQGPLEYCPQTWYENMFWIAIEALNNALKHAQARNTKIVLHCSRECVELDIVDDGIGFDTDRKRVGGMGLKNMSERAVLLGGQLKILSSPGNGTRIHFHAEIKENYG